MPENSQLRQWAAGFKTGLERMSELTDGLTREQFNVKPAPDKWSIGQCIEHLNVSMGIYLDPMEPVAEKAKEKGGEPYGRGTFMGRLLINALRKPGKTYRTPGSFEPSNSDLDLDKVRTEFERQTGRFLKLTERLEGLALGKLKMPWPALRLIKITLAQALELQVLHINRHLNQAARVKEAAKF